jgi:excisionase family DNA binding protein
VKTPDDEVLTLSEVAAYLKVTERTIYWLAAVRGARAFKIGGVWRFRTNDIGAWVYAQSVNLEGIAR